MFKLDQYGTVRSHPISSGVKRLTLTGSTINNLNIPDKEGNGFSRLTAKKRTNGAMPFFYVCMSSCALNGRRWWGGFRACWFSFLHQSTNPTICRPPRLVAGRGPTAKKDHIMPRYVSTTSTNSLPIASQSAIKLASKKPVKLKAGQLTSLHKGILNAPATGGYFGGCDTGAAMATALMKELRVSDSSMAFMRMADMIRKLTDRIEAEGGAAMGKLPIDERSEAYTTLRGQYIGFTHTLGQWLQFAARFEPGDLDQIDDDELLAEASAGLNFDEAAYIASTVGKRSKK